ncbi:hypothetical protein P6F26_02050 [Roseibacterium sp. SDUM158017]|uniref:hypothetical protein n=1 Tax=Roseicyclus salinarum TaxID=3036773 RepID=UPI0024150B04|nr:hypothetical protein [Roseibacterium sp. SDUM158017]MDG4647214.1 hypothetical protein [Roseibacterium sp. SDUM158017]
MRKTQMAELRRSGRIVVRAESTGGSPRTTAPVRRAETPVKRPTPAVRTPRGATMDYQMGFTSGPSN